MTGQPWKPRPKYKWKQWLALEYFELVQGIDFDGSISNMTQQIRNMASRAGKSAHIKEEVDGTIRVMLREKEPKEEVKSADAGT